MTDMKKTDKNTYLYSPPTRRIFGVFVVVSIACNVGSASGLQRMIATSTPCNTYNTPFCNALMDPIAGWRGPVFRLSQNYPVSHVGEPQPWKAIDPRLQPEQYLRTVLSYFYEGNIKSDPEASFDPFSNPVRPWYHAPWQDFGVNGREFVHGLTRERSSRPRELHPNQLQLWANYAVGFYNPPGGAVIGRVWANRASPNAAAAQMPEGTVAAKLLFTTAPAAEVPYLQGAPEWTGYVYSDVHNDKPKIDSPRQVTKLRLLQIDLAVKDSRVADTTGWVFGTFVYGGGIDGPRGAGWSNVHPVGVMWGNDPNYSGSGSLTETILNKSVHLPHYGFQGRLNGPVDNPASSCLSCHSTAQVPEAPMLPVQGADPGRWFKNYKSGQPFNPGAISTDYSLQLSVGIANFTIAQRALRAVSIIETNRFIESINPEARPPRDGGPIH